MKHWQTQFRAQQTFWVCHGCYRVHPAAHYTAANGRHGLTSKASRVKPGKTELLVLLGGLPSPEHLSLLCGGSILWQHSIAVARPNTHGVHGGVSTCQLSPVEQTMQGGRQLQASVRADPCKWTVRKVTGCTASFAGHHTTCCRTPTTVSCQHKHHAGNRPGLWS
jgi:hypothetical protein